MGRVFFLQVDPFPGRPRPALLKEVEGRLPPLPESPVEAADSEPVKERVLLGLNRGKDAPQPPHRRVMSEPIFFHSLPLASVAPLPVPTRYLTPSSEGPYRPCEGHTPSPYQS